MRPGRLDALGVLFGDPAVPPMEPGPDNEAGYWENRPIKELDDDLLAHLGGSWDSPPVLAPGWEHDSALAEFRVRATETIEATFGPVPSRIGPIGWKDPRLSLLLPFWRTVCPVEGTIVIVRNPSEVAASLAARNDTDTTAAHLLAGSDTCSPRSTNDEEQHLLLDHDRFSRIPSTPCGPSLFTSASRRPTTTSSGPSSITWTLRCDTTTPRPRRHRLPLRRTRSWPWPRRSGTAAW